MQAIQQMHGSQTMPVSRLRFENKETKIEKFLKVLGHSETLEAQVSWFLHFIKLTQSSLQAVEWGF